MSVIRARLEHAKMGVVSTSPLISDSTVPIAPRYHMKAAKADIRIRLGWHCFDFIREDEKFQRYFSEEEIQ